MKYCRDSSNTLREILPPITNCLLLWEKIPSHREQPTLTSLFNLLLQFNLASSGHMARGLCLAVKLMGTKGQYRNRMALPRVKDQT